MAHTETRPGFRLPWTGERTESGSPVDEAGAPPVADANPPAEEPVTPDMIDTNSAASVRRPTKFMAELSRAMQTAAEHSRDETMARFGADAKTVVEGIHAASTVELASVRRRADDDVAAVREWSKAEIARIRELTEARIAVRKTALDGEMDAHTAVVEARVQRVAASVTEFEDRMAAFFERLLAEEDPTRIATMAETMPDPPDLSDIAAGIAEPAIAPFDPVPASMAGWRDAEPAAANDPEASQASNPVEPNAVRDFDFAAAEAEAAAFTGDFEDGEDGRGQASADGGQAPVAPSDPAAPAIDAPAGTGRVTTRVTVLGLVSVASIATFKRTLSRSPGVAAIGVSSGPDGEFVFSVDHEANLALGDAIVALPGFEARITAQKAGGLDVAAHDPDAGD
jgi:hypothetical protein